MKYNFDDLKSHHLTPQGIDTVNEKLAEIKRGSIKKLAIQTAVTVLIIIGLSSFINVPVLIYSLIAAQVIGFLYMYLRLSTSGNVDEDTLCYRGKIVKFQKTLTDEMAGVQLSNQAVFYVKVDKLSFDVNEIVYVVYVNDATQILVRKL